MNYSITSKNIGKAVLPIVYYIKREKPDYIIACDRGARLIGLATIMLYRQLYGRLPTIDGTIRFRKFSKRYGSSLTKRYLTPLVKEMLKNKKRPKVLVLDDRIYQGHTQKIIGNVLDELSHRNIDTKIGVISDLTERADVESIKASYAFGDWDDNPTIIGVDYKNWNNIINRLLLRVFKPSIVKSESRVYLRYREDVSRNIKKLVKRLESRL